MFGSVTIVALGLAEIGPQSNSIITICSAVKVTDVSHD